MLWKQQVSIFVVIIWADYILCFYSEAFSSKTVYATTSWEKAKQHSRGICFKIASCKFPLTKLAWFMIEETLQCTYYVSDKSDSGLPVKEHLFNTYTNDYNNS